jgi:hypothetical protein
VEINPGFNKDTLENDLAVITLSSPVTIVGGIMGAGGGKLADREV